MLAYKLLPDTEQKYVAGIISLSKFLVQASYSGEASPRAHVYGGDLKQAQPSFHCIANDKYMYMFLFSFFFLFIITL